MPYNVVKSTWDKDELMLKLEKEKFAANELQTRKHEDWESNYELYRNKVRTNRLTQRQAVNIPLMKETIKTQLSQMDEAPSVEWSELGGDEQKELIYQEIWNDTFKMDKLELVDVLDKKNVLNYGIGTKKLNIKKDGIKIDALDPYDVVFDPLMRVGDIESARFIIHQNIFRSVREILADDKYTEAGKEELKLWADSPAGITHGKDNEEKWEEKMKRIRAMGVDNSDFPLYAGGDRLINLTEHFTTVWNKDKWERRVVVYADNQVELYNETLYDCIGVDFWPFTVWVEDPDTTDIYSDSIADLIRPLNKVLNVWFSQLIENRTLKNFQMHWVSASEGYTPTTYTPGPGVQLPAPPIQPGQSIKDVVMPVEISGLDDTLQAIQAITQIAERASGATAIQKGEPEQGEQTLGEVKILVGKAQERTVAMAKFYRMAWYETAWKWDKLMHANGPRFKKLYKAGPNGKMYPKRVFKNDWKSEVGYEPTIASTSEQERQDIQSIQKWVFAKSQFPNNPAIAKITAKRIFESLDVTPEELKQIEEAEDQVQAMATPIPAQPAPVPQAPTYA